MAEWSGLSKLSLLSIWVQSLIGKVTSHKPCDAAKTINANKSVLESLPLGLVASFSLCTLASLSSRREARVEPLSCSPVWVQVAVSGSTVSFAGIICLVLNFQEFFHKFFRLISASVVKTVW